MSIECVDSLTRSLSHSICVSVLFVCMHITPNSNHPFSLSFIRKYSVPQFGIFKMISCVYMSLWLILVCVIFTCDLRQNAQRHEKLNWILESVQFYVFSIFFGFFFLEKSRQVGRSKITDVCVFSQLFAFHFGTFDCIFEHNTMSAMCLTEHFNSGPNQMHWQWILLISKFIFELNQCG